MFLSAPVFAQDRLILECDVDRQQIYYEGSTQDINGGKDKIQIDITPSKSPSANYMSIEIKGSKHFRLSAWVPLNGEYYESKSEDQLEKINNNFGVNRSDEDKLVFVGKTNYGSIMATGFFLTIDRLTGLLDGSLKTGFNIADGETHTTLIGYCKKVEHRARKF
jgi:hypothetical protein